MTVPMMSTLLTGPLAALTLSLAAWFVLVNAMTLTAFYIDKRRTVAGEWGVPDRTLLMLSAIGGWPGAKLSQLWLRPQTDKRGFRILLNLSILPMLMLVGFFAAQDVDWAGLTDQATAKAMALLGQTPQTTSAPTAPAKPTMLVMGKTSAAKVAASDSALPQLISPGTAKSAGAWHSR